MVNVLKEDVKLERGMVSEESLAHVDDIQNGGDYLMRYRKLYEVVTWRL